MNLFNLFTCVVLSGSIVLSGRASAQERMTPELLLQVKRVGGSTVSGDGKSLYYTVRGYNLSEDKNTAAAYVLDISSGERKELQLPEGKRILLRNGQVWYAQDDSVLYRSADAGRAWNAVYSGLKHAENIRIAPDEKHIAFSRKVQLKQHLGKDLYPDLPNTSARVYTDLHYRHWDSWMDGTFNHLFVAALGSGTAADIMKDEPYHTPQVPFGGAEDFTWSPDGRGIVYVCKKLYGKEYAQSTNTDLYYYDLATGVTNNITEGMMGYDTEPAFSPSGKYLAWTSMARDGYESDKNDIVIADVSGLQSAPVKVNLTAGWDGTVNSFRWSRDGKKIFFNAAVKGTVQLFEVSLPVGRKQASVRQITSGKFDVNGLIGESGKELLVSRTDMNRAAEVFAVNVASGSMRPLTKENDSLYGSITLSETELRMIGTTDGLQMGVWVVYPPGFDSTKKYPVLLYCQGGPQSALTQFYSLRWNFQLMAAEGYIVVAPNRRGMPGWGVEWNEAISRDWGGQPMRDYLSAIDDVAKESYVDRERIGCVGASYGGYSVLMLAGIHENRFRSFISHNGLFDLKAWYGTTEELWFANWDVGGPYWKEPAKSYALFDPSSRVEKWNTPIMIIQGGLDYRVPIEQGLGAFQAAQLRGVKSKLLYFPDENHWVLQSQNALAWQREFFRWLKETMPE